MKANKKTTKKIKIAIIASHYYPDITQNLINNFKAAFSANKNHKNIEFIEHTVFGTAEIPFVVNQLSASQISAIAVFGCVIEGKTYHHQLINQYVYNKIYDLAIAKNLPLAYGILNTKNLKQARQRQLTRSQEAYQSLKLLLHL